MTPRQQGMVALVAVAIPLVLGMAGGALAAGRSAPAPTPSPSVRVDERYSTDGHWYRCTESGDGANGWRLCSWGDVLPPLERGQ